MVLMIIANDNQSTKRSVKISNTSIHLLDRVEVVAAVGNLGVHQLDQLVRDRFVLLNSPLQDRARPPVARGDEEIDLLTSADERVAGVVGVQDHEAGRANRVEWEADVHLGRLSFVGSVQLASVLVLMVQPNLFAVRQLSQLSNLLEAELI